LPLISTQKTIPEWRSRFSVTRSATSDFFMLHAKYSMENDILAADWLRQKIRVNTEYAQSLYAGLCNNLFHKIGAEDDALYSFSWRHAGNVIAAIRENETYLDWYCSGLISGATAEGVVTEEVKTDLNQLGWEIWTDVLQQKSAIMSKQTHFALRLFMLVYCFTADFKYGKKTYIRFAGQKYA
jgi:hypothetical protein